MLREKTSGLGNATLPFGGTFSTVTSVNPSVPRGPTAIGSDHVLPENPVLHSEENANTVAPNETTNNTNHTVK